MFGKSQIVLGVLVVTLALAVFLNMKYSTETVGSDEAVDSDRNLGEALYVNNDVDDSIETSAKLTYIETSKKDRNTERNEKIAEIKKTLEDSGISESIKKDALSELNKISARIENESNIETIITSKGFSDALAIISDESVTVIVEKSEELLSSETLQIQDAVTSQIDISLEKIKIITVK